mgnify:CR=1 FL=1
MRRAKRGLGQRKTRVMLVDDHPFFRQGLRRLLESEGRFEVVAEASCGYQAVYQAHLHRPELALVDIQLPGITGLQVARMLIRQQPRVRIVLVSTQRSEEWLIDAARVGAAAFVLKDARPEEMIETLDRVIAGHQVLSGLVLSRPDLASLILRELRQLGSASEQAPSENQLTARELEVLDCVAQGMSNKEIADTLFITEQTVKNHMTSVLRKLEAEDRVEAILNAVRRGWVVIGPRNAPITAG